MAWGKNQEGVCTISILLVSVCSVHMFMKCIRASVLEPSMRMKYAGACAVPATLTRVPNTIVI